MTAKMTKMTYKITITFNDKDLTTDALLRTANFLSEQLESMHMSHVLECRKDRIMLGKLAK